MGQPPNIMYTDGKTSIRNNGLFQKYFNENKISVTPDGNVPSQIFLFGPSNPCWIRG